jgi:MtrB/PioB family decaheme-associated outer membrane protein
MKKYLILTCMFSLLLLSYSFAEETNPLSGGIFLGGRAINGDAQHSANFNQYNGIAPGLFGGGNILYDKDRYYFRAEGAYLGEDDFNIRVKGGKCGDYKYSLYFTEWPHNLSYGDRTIYLAPGTQTQVLPSTTVPRNSNNWPSTSFNNQYLRKDIGGTFDLTMIKPFFFNVDANQLRREGNMPWAAAAPGGGLHSNTTEFSVPIDDSTSNVNATAGWKSKQYFAALTSGFSKYSNSSERTVFQEPFSPFQANATVGPPDNKSWYLKATGTAKLPLSSTFAVTGSFTENTSETNLANTFANFTVPGVAGSVRPLGGNTFHGDVQYWNVAANLTSNPWTNLTTKLYYKYLDKKNKSDVVTFVDTSTGNTFGSEAFDYQTTTFGGEAAYRFLKNLKGIVGYEFSDTRRRNQETTGEEASEASSTLHAPDVKISDTWDNKFTGQLVWNPLDWLGARLKYQKLYRGANFNYAQGVDYTSTDSSQVTAGLGNFLRPYYTANKTQDMIKGTIDLTPMANLDLTAEYAFKHDNYDKQVLGFYKDQQHEFILDGSYDWKGVKFFGFFDYDMTWTDQQLRQATTGGSNPASGLVSSTGFNWRAGLKNDNYAYGTGTSFPIIKNKLAFIVQYDFEKNNGTADFTSQFRNAAITNANLLNINPWDDYTKQSISARFKYDVTKQFGLMFGYIYSQFRYNDGQLPAVDPNQTSTTINGYRYVLPATGAASTYLTGAYADQNYNANIFYVRAMYKF